MNVFIFIVFCIENNENSVDPDQRQGLHCFVELSMFTYMSPRRGSGIPRVNSIMFV